MKIALVHDHLIQDGGAERVLFALQQLFPAAPIYTLLFDEKRMGRAFLSSRVKSSYLQKFPLPQSRYQWLLPLMSHAIESFDLTDYDVVLSSSSAFAKGVLTKSHTVHICYCHTPTRYLWSDTHSYVRELRTAAWVKAVSPLILHSIRQWDRAAADRVDLFVANSKTVQGRIRKYYRRESEVVYPPVAVENFCVRDGAGEYYLAGGRLVSYKRFDIVVDAFNKIDQPLKIFGTGPDFQKLKRRAKKNIEFLGFVSEEQKRDLYQCCVAFINPQEEDFGITAIEAAACGRPVIAYAAGGALETIADGVTGTFFEDQDAAALIDVLLRFNPDRFNPNRIRSHSEKYKTERFVSEIKAIVDGSVHTAKVIHPSS